MQASPLEEGKWCVEPLFFCCNVSPTAIDQAPGNLYHPPKWAGILQNIANSPCFKRLTSFPSNMFRMWMPNLHTYYDNSFSHLLGHKKHLHPNFKSSVWAATAYNFGPQAITAKHRDWANLPFSICAMTTLGNYNPKAGGHIVLWELGLIIEFPPSSTILIPSTAIAHLNTPIAMHKRRVAFTQYSAGGLFHWVDHSFQTNAKFMRKLLKKEKEALNKSNKACCKLGLSLFSTLLDLCKTQM